MTTRPERPAAAPAVAIRPVTIDDLDVLIEIYLDTARHHAAIDPEVFHVPDRDAITARLRRRIEGRGITGEYVAAMLGDTMVGSASVDIADPPSAGNMARAVPSAEFGVSVVEGYRGHGIGRALIEHVERWAADHGIERMILTVSEANEGAIRLYHAMGYRDYDRTMLKRLRPGADS
ncbi:MAG TPA: GNAT family N-acetyltransferase [Candidatus Limnocylindrales bacterium]|nr:GNAT family N-acetyltransferase [Candidatus Limnocylindrales bacterium]